MILPVMRIRLLRGERLHISDLGSVEIIKVAEACHGADIILA